jgi:hypothetical protein
MIITSKTVGTAIAATTMKTISESFATLSMLYSTIRQYDGVLATRTCYFLRFQVMQEIKVEEKKENSLKLNSDTNLSS